MQIFRARCLAALGRCDEAVALAREAGGDCCGGGAEPELIALWIESSISNHCARDAEAAFDALLPETPVEIHYRSPEGLRAWQLAHMPRHEQRAHLEELAEVAPNTALALLLSSGSLAIVARLGALEVVDGKLREPALARVLAQTGHPDVGLALQAASERASHLEHDLDQWSRANAAWNALAVVR
jgi:hypothetical protein